jgi:lipopolysaccharide transport system ATP-binding protein
VVVVRIEKLSKAYRLGEISRKVLWQDWRHRFHSRAAGANDEAEPFWALRDISFDVRDGEILGILGRNGAGKSTLLKVISQITTPTEGSVKLRGRVASLLEVGTGFHVELTGRDNIFLNGTILGMTRAEVARKFDEIVAFSGIEEFIDTPVKRYSVGMRVRLAFAVAAHLEPEILVIDEVLAVGDAAFQQKCLGKIGEVSRSGRTVLFVSHNAASIESLCTRGIVLDKGRLAFEGSQIDAIDFYAASRSAAGVDLETFAERGGSGEVRIVGMEVRNVRGQSMGGARSGEAIEIAMRYRRHSHQTFPRLAVQLFVTTHVGAPVFTHANWLNGDGFGDLPASGTFFCRIPRLPLPPGHYRVGFRLQAVHRGQEPIDAIESALELNVESGDFFRTGKMPQQHFGVALVDADWRLEAAEATDEMASTPSV